MSKPQPHTRLFFFDIDGTLVPNESEQGPSSGVRRALAQLREDGHRIFLCTGRTLCDIGPALRALNFDGIIAASGAYVSVDGQCIHHRCMSLPLVRRAVELLISNHISGVLSGPETLYYAGRGRELPWDLERLERGSDVTARMQIEKFTAHVSAPGEFAPLRAALEQECHISVSDDRLFYEMTEKGTSKATAVEILCRYLHRGMEDTVAFGDSENDVPLFRKAGLRVVMGNASPAVKQYADYITDTVENDGIVSALNHFGFLGKDWI